MPTPVPHNVPRPASLPPTEAPAVAAGSPKREPRLCLPPEHGSWGMLLFPFVSAAILTKTWTWDFVLAALAMLAVFLLREPLTVLLRQKFVWKRRRPE